MRASLDSARFAASGYKTSLDVFRFVPTSGDTRYLGVSDFGRARTSVYMRQIVIAADDRGYDGPLIPTGSTRLDP